MRTRPTLSAITALACVVGLAVISTASAGGSTDPTPDPPPPASTLYVSVDGTGSACTLDAPCGTLTAAMSVATSGATVYLESGSYPRQDLGYHPNVANFAAPVLIRPAPDADVQSAGLFIDTSNVIVRYLTVLGGGIKISAKNVRVGYSLVDGEGIDGGLNAAHGAGISVSGSSSNVTIRGTTIQGLVDRDGIDVGDGADPQSNLRFVQDRILYAVEGTLLHHTDCFQLYGGQTNVLLYRNLFVGCTVSEIHLQASTAPIQGVDIRRNAFIDCTTPGANHCDYYTVYIESTAHSTISDVRMNHNTVTGNIQLQTHPTQFADNIVTGNFGDATCGGAWESHNLIGRAPDANACPTGPRGQHDKVGLPTFTDPANLDFTLLPTSLGQGLGQ